MPQHLNARLEGSLWQGPVRRLWDRSKGEESFDAYTAVADALARDDLARAAAATGTAQKALETADMKLLTGPAHVAWMKQLSDLCINETCFVHDGSEGLGNALHSVYGPMATQRCICHKLTNVWSDVADKDKRRSIRKDASAISDADTEAQARERPVAFRRKWKRRGPKAVATLCRQFGATLTYFRIPVEHRRWMRTTNPVERTIRELRRRTRPIGVFQGVGSCRQLVYVAVKKLSNHRRNAIPYSLWTSQPAYGAKRRTRRPPAPRSSSLLRGVRCPCAVPVSASESS